MLFHSIKYDDNNILDGCVSLDTLNQFYSNLHLPNDIAGKTILDIGAANGYYSIELARAGAKVTAINIDEEYHKSLTKNILLCNVDIKALHMSIYDLDKIDEQFDIVLLLGVIYHLRYPLLGIDLAVNKTNSLIIIESHCCVDDRPIMEFYDKDQINNDSTNWWGPSELCIHQMLTSAGCKSTQKVSTYDYLYGKRIVIHGNK